MIITALIILMGITMVVSAIFALMTRNLLMSVIAVGILSLFSSIIYLIMQAPDVAMTEAAIGAGLSTVIFLFALRKTTDRDVNDD
jgi:energy-converting hydrogenase B subunit D